ncbi:MAG: GNAT family N-acetyltransferase [Polyangiaceae bacterium]|jgi:GNAT superfamily N-acetyltransferase
MIRSLSVDDHRELLVIINDAAEAYRGVIPADRFHDPYFAERDLSHALSEGVVFAGFAEEDGRLLGVMGVQPCGDVALIRHAYVRTAHRGKGIGSRLLRHLMSTEPGPLLVGTWAQATWAIRFYEKHGYRLVSADEKNELLKRYWDVPERQIETSVVLADARFLEASVRELGIATARKDDAATLLRIQKVAFEREAADNGVRCLPPIAQDLDGFVREMDAHIVRCAKLRGRLVGLIRGRMEGDSCHVGRLAVLPDYQRRGIGRRLLADLESHFAEAARFELFTGTKSAGNVRLYTRMGYRAFRTVAGEPDLVYMEKRNSPGPRA